MAMFVFMSFTSVVVDAEMFADRMSITLTMVLTGVAFKVVIGNYLPTISYLTVTSLLTYWVA